MLLFFSLQVEHSTNRAVIIDLGLAKFFRHGLNSALDEGNTAYSAPEVLQRLAQRSHCSDVWAMGKIIAELCARVRLPTTSVCPEKIKETLKDQPYCKAVCRMVKPNPSLRASMAGVLGDIRRAGEAESVTNTSIQKELLKPPAAYITNRNQSPSPINGGANLLARDQLVGNRDPAPKNKSPSLQNRESKPRPEIKNVSPQIGLPISAAAERAEDKNKNQELVPVGKADLTGEFMKMKLHQEVTRDLPFNLPTTGRVMVRRFEERNGKCDRWEQKEVVTCDGRITKFNEFKFDTK